MSPHSDVFRRWGTKCSPPLAQILMCIGSGGVGRFMLEIQLEVQLVALRPALGQCGNLATWTDPHHPASFIKSLSEQDMGSSERSGMCFLIPAGHSTLKAALRMQPYNWLILPFHSLQMSQDAELNRDQMGFFTTALQWQLQNNCNLTGKPSTMNNNEVYTSINY